MRRAMIVALVVLLAIAGQARAQLSGIDALRSKASLSDADRQQLYQILTKAVDAMVTNTEPDRRGMVASREAIVAEAKNEANQSASFKQAYGDEAVHALKDAEKKAVSAEARVNLLMVLAELKRPEALPIFITALDHDPYDASRYWAARGLSMTADVVVERSLGRQEQDMCDAAAKVFQGDLPDVMAMQLFEMLGKFDSDRAHDVLVDAATRYVQHASAGNQIVARSLVGVVASLERAYTREVRPEAKPRLLGALAVLCAWIMPPVGEPTLMPRLNATLELITGQKVGFSATDEPTWQKLSLMEWVEKLYREKRIAKRPPLPPAVESVAKSLQQAPAPAPAGGTATGATP